MLKNRCSILFFLIGVAYGQTATDSTIEVSAGSSHIKQWDDNLFYCNWNNTQTFAYFVPCPDTTGGVALELLKGEEKFTLPQYGTLWSVFKKTHKGLDIDLETGDSVVNMFDGIVRYAQFNNGGFGNLVIVRHYNGLETYYGHLSKIKVKVDQKVKSGELLGLGGSTGRSYNPHLHLEVRYQDHPVDPFAFIDWTGKKLKSNVLVLEKKVFSPWDMGIEPVDISSPNFKTVSNPVVNTNTNITNESTDPNASYHIIKKGDTLYSIAKANGTTLQQICDWNGIKDPDKIFLGQKIRVK
jgi:LysM repeat protein